jgi:hypothetical protein
MHQRCGGGFSFGPGNPHHLLAVISNKQRASRSERTKGKRTLPGSTALVIAIPGDITAYWPLALSREVAPRSDDVQRNRGERCAKCLSAGTLPIEGDQPWGGLEALQASGKRSALSPHPHNQNSLTRQIREGQSVL